MIKKYKFIIESRDGDWHKEKIIPIILKDNINKYSLCDILKGETENFVWSNIDIWCEEIKEG